MSRVLFNRGARRGTPARQNPAGQRNARSLAVLRAQNRQLKARFDLISKATSDGLWDIEIIDGKLSDPENNYWCSQQFRRLLGFRDENDFPNHLSSWSSRLHPDDRERTLAAFHAHVADRTGATPCDLIYRLRCRDGEYRWFHALGYTERGPDGRALRVAGALTDITDRNTLMSIKRYAETVIASLPAGLLILDDALRVVDANRALQCMLGLAQAGEIRGLPIDAVLPQAGLADQARAILAGAATVNGIPVQLPAKHLRVSIAGLSLECGEQRLLVVAEDVTAEYRLREEAREHAARHRDQAALLDKAHDAIIVRGIDGTAQFWNKGAERMYGWSAREALGQSVDALLSPDLDDSAVATAATLAEGEWSGELEQVRKDGSALTVASQWTLVRDDSQQPKAILVINTDVTERKASDARIRSLALYDVLTGLPNRTLFADRLTQALAKAERHGTALSLLFVDLNRFKEINDTQGHGVGDQVLVKVAQRLRAAMREDETLARLAGDEFVVIAENAGQDAARAIAQRLEHALAQPIANNGHTFSVGMSIGISTYPVDGKTMDDLLRCADIAMYRAKTSGGGHVFYLPEMSVGLAERMELARDLGRALQHEELELYFQPQVSLASGRLVGAEVLLRWHDPERGWVSPAVFVPIAESRGMIAAVGAWVLREACAQLREWREAGLVFPGRLSVNLAAQQLEQANLAQDIQSLVAAAGLPPGCLDLELTESGLMANVERAIGIMASLREAGFSISIDDFGTGYSSLAYLKRLPADKLKIDISFVREMLTDRHDHTIVNTIIGMARNLGLKVIAEGVEVEAQAEALRALGCDEAQGYYFGRPMPAEEFARRWLGANSQR